MVPQLVNTSHCCLYMENKSFVTYSKNLLTSYLVVSLCTSFQLEFHPFSRLNGRNVFCSQEDCLLSKLPSVYTYNTTTIAHG